MLTKKLANHVVIHSPFCGEIREILLGSDYDKLGIAGCATAETKPAAAATADAAKPAEGSCGAEKKAEGSCGAEKKAGEGSCGEGSCGATPK